MFYKALPKSTFKKSICVAIALLTKPWILGAIFTCLTLSLLAAPTKAPKLKLILTHDLTGINTHAAADSIISLSKEMISSPAIELSVPSDAVLTSNLIEQKISPTLGSDEKTMVEMTAEGIYPPHLKGIVLKSAEKLDFYSLGTAFSRRANDWAADGNYIFADDSARIIRTNFTLLQTPDQYRIDRLYGTADHSWVITAIKVCFFVLIFILGVYSIRHWTFTLNRLFGRTRAPYVDIDVADWPPVTVFIAAHNEEAVISGCIRAMLEVDYPADKLKIVPINDRSTDTTKQLIDEYTARYPDRLFPFHRSQGVAGKAAALKDAMPRALSDIVIIFDADYIPGRGLIKQLVAPFFDPEVGAVMGRVVPINTGRNLLTRLLDLERSAGYQVDQQARMNLSLVPQYGGTVGGLRRSAVEAAGGWHDDILAEDTDITYRLLLQGWKTVYQNRSECYEEVPESWPVRIRQIMRWSKGHNQVCGRCVVNVLASRRLSLPEKIDGLLLLGVFLLPTIILAGTVLTLIMYFANIALFANIAIMLLALTAFSATGNFAAFFQIVAAVRLDGNSKRVRMLPLTLLGFLVSAVSISRATLSLVLFDWLFRRDLVWDKTTRYRPSGFSI